MNNPQEIIENLQRHANNDAREIAALKLTIENQNLVIQEQRATINNYRTDLATLKEKLLAMTAGHIPKPSTRVAKASLQATIDLAMMQTRTANEDPAT